MTLTPLQLAPFAEQVATSPIVYGILGGALYGSTFAGKARAEGEPFIPLKWAITVAIGGIIGLVFEVVGFRPDPEIWYLILAAFAGLVMEIETIGKLLARGQTDEARLRLPYLSREMQQGVSDVIIATTAGDLENVINDRIEERLPEGYGPRDDGTEGSYERAVGRLDDIHADPQGLDHERFLTDEPGPAEGDEGNSDQITRGGSDDEYLHTTGDAGDEIDEVDSDDDSSDAKNG